MKKQILELREQGKTYREIEEILGCSKGTISYHCGKGQKEKYKQRQQTLRKDNALLLKVDSFLRPSSSKRTRRKTDDEISSSCNKQISDKICSFGRCKENFFNYKDVINRFGENPNCYLSGRPIDLSAPRSFSFDHIVPCSKGGSSSIDNLGITRRECNQAKSDLSVEEFLELCVDVLKHNGYTVSK